MEQGVESLHEETEADDKREKRTNEEDRTDSLFAQLSRQTRPNEQIVACSSNRLILTRQGSLVQAVHCVDMEQVVKVKSRALGDITGVEGN